MQRLAISHQQTAQNNSTNTIFNWLHNHATCPSTKSDLAHLTIESFLGALATLEAAPFEKRINGWFNAVERYPRHFDEMEQTAYLVMKRNEYLRQQQDERVGTPG